MYTASGIEIYISQLNEEQSYFRSCPRAFAVSQIYSLTVQSMIWQFRLLDRHAVFYPGHVSSLAGDLRGPVKNRKPRAIARIADALFFSREPIHRHLSSRNRLSPLLPKKKKRRVRMARPFNRSRGSRTEAKINFNVDRFSAV